MDADAVGFVFAPSQRRVRPEDVRDIVKRLPHETMTVGVFRNERPETVVETVNKVGLRAAQLHGGEPDSEVEYVTQRVPVVIRALPAGDERLEGAASWPTDLVLVDGPAPGSGQVFDWSLTTSVPTSVRLLLAGGLDPDNVTAAVQQVRPFGVDVSSGVEASPGRKDPVKVRQFVERARQAAAAYEADGYEGGGEPPYDWMADR